MRSRPSIQGGVAREQRILSEDSPQQILQHQVASRYVERYLKIRDEDKKAMEIRVAEEVLSRLGRLNSGMSVEESERPDVIVRAKRNAVMGIELTELYAPTDSDLEILDTLGERNRSDFGGKAHHRIWSRWCHTADAIKNESTRHVSETVSAESTMSILGGPEGS